MWNWFSKQYIEETPVETFKHDIKKMPCSQLKNMARQMEYNIEQIAYLNLGYLNDDHIHEQQDKLEVLRVWYNKECI